jgi:hypothetical protein
MATDNQTTDFIVLTLPSGRSVRITRQPYNIEFDSGEWTDEEWRAALAAAGNYWGKENQHDR